ncbi:MAG: PilW family protein [Rhodoferax sp.]|uniref:PilW family protein n=1 Tax=Rhodoferax sp. TaxID=50421 RepID=UPI0032672119
MTHSPSIHRQRGVTLIELMVTLAITLFLVAAAAYAYLGTRETQRAIERNSSNTEVGAFVLQLIGQDIMKAGYYPANISRVLTASEGFPKLSKYPPLKQNENPTQLTDWTLPADPNPTLAYYPLRQARPMGPYGSGLFGCKGAKFKPSTGICDTAVDGAPDSIVVNYFTNDSLDGNTGDRTDCTGADVGNDTSNTNRIGTAGLAPSQPLFVSNRYGINATKVEIDKQTINTFSLACNGNGASGSKPNPAAALSGNGKANDTYQPMIAGIEDLQITYGVFAATGNQNRRTPDKFYEADDVGKLDWVEVDDPPFPKVFTPPWSRVVAVRVCVMALSPGAAPKIGNAASAPATYVDCNDVTQTQKAGDFSLRKRFVQVFAVRNRLNQVF